MDNLCTVTINMSAEMKSDVTYRRGAFIRRVDNSYVQLILVFFLYIITAGIGHWNLKNLIIFNNLIKFNVRLLFNYIFFTFFFFCNNYNSFL